MARTNIRTEKTHTHRCRRSPAIKRSMSVPRGSGCVSGPWQTNSWWTPGLVPALQWTRAVICERRASSHLDISVPTCCGRAQSLSTWDKAPNPPLDTSSCDSSAGTGAALSFGCSYTGKNIIRMFCINAWVASYFRFPFLSKTRCLSAILFMWLTMRNAFWEQRYVQRWATCSLNE